MGDYHVHLHEHGPYTGVGPPPAEYPAGHIEAYVEVARARGVEEVGFTEHLYRCVESADALGAFWEAAPTPGLAEFTRRFTQEDRQLSLDRYVDAVLDAKNRGLPVLLGLEVDFFPESIERVLRLLEPYPWDFLIGSIHWVGGWSVDHSGSVDEFARRGVDKAYEDYFALETALAASGSVDVLAHADVVKKFGHLPSRVPQELYTKVAAAAAATSTAVEVSTAGLHRPVGEMYPAPAFLDAFYEAGVAITLASDTHTPEGTGLDFDVAIAAAKRAGYTERVRFDQRRRSLVQL